MIGSLRGTVAEKQPPHLLVDVHGVGYELEAPMSTFYVLPEVGGEIFIHTHLVVREDAHVLYGFATSGERSLFRALIRVSGIGAKLALAVLSGMDSQTFVRCVEDGDTVALSRLPGIGKKTAERLIVEMRDRLGVLELQSGVTLSGVGPRSATPAPSEDAVTALEALGYRVSEARKMVRAVDTTDLSSEEIIRRALQSAVQR